ncbi:MAG: protein kinase [Candidatus Moduliflexus flocculans]|nr:protein kinase [Candidatus Moduliflexus flocculans]
MDELIGTTLKHYRVETQLGKGGMGVVYRARDTRLDRPVALKMITPGLIADPERRARLLLEARSAAAISHPAIAQVYDIDEVDGNLFIAMEYVDGRTVTRLIADGELDLLGALEIVLQVAEGLAKAHDAGILHRDIKSDNIMVTKDGHAKLLDFGLAKLVEPDSGAPERAGGLAGLSRTLTQGRVQTIPGAVMGTISYMSPEQARGKELDRRSDIFSLGTVLYEMVTSELPFKGETPLDTMHAIAYEEARPVTIVRRNLTPELHRIVFRCLRKNPDDRYADAHLLAADLRRLMHNLETGTRTEASSGRTRPELGRLVQDLVPGRLQGDGPPGRGGRPRRRPGGGRFQLGRPDRAGRHRPLRLPLLPQPEKAAHRRLRQEGGKIPGGPADHGARQPRHGRRGQGPGQGLPAHHGARRRSQPGPVLRPGRQGRDQVGDPRGRSPDDAHAGRRHLRPGGGAAYLFIFSTAAIVSPDVRRLRVLGIELHERPQVRQGLVEVALVEEGQAEPVVRLRPIRLDARGHLEVADGLVDPLVRRRSPRRCRRRRGRSGISPGPGGTPLGQPQGRPASGRPRPDRRGPGATSPCAGPRPPGRARPCRGRPGTRPRPGRGRPFSGGPWRC